MVHLIAVLYLSVVSGYLFVTRGRWLINPGPLFVVAQSILFLGILPLLDMTLTADRVHLQVMFWGLCFFVLGTLVVDAFVPASRRPIGQFSVAPFHRIESGVAFNLVTELIIWVSIIVSLIYYQSVGYNVFLTQLVNIIHGHADAIDVTTFRLETYSTDRYLAPGYVNQFKNTLLPIMVGYLVARYLLLHNKRDRLMIWLFTPLAIVFVLGTGQRGPFVVVSIICMVFLNISLPRIMLRRVNLVIVGALAMVFSIATLVLGRTVTEISSAGDLWTLGTEIAGRIFSANQESALYGFRYIYGLPVQNGMDWAKDLTSMIPGLGKGSTIAHDVYQIMFGTDRGTAPLSLFGSIMYNFGLVGVVVIPITLGIVYQTVYVRFVSGSKTLFRILVYATLSVLLGFWVQGGPGFLTNSGLVTIVILRFVVSAWLQWCRRVLGHDGETKSLPNAS